MHKSFILTRLCGGLCARVRLCVSFFFFFGFGFRFIFGFGFYSLGACVRVCVQRAYICKLMLEKPVGSANVN